jgi:hypothetical protein
MKRGFKRAPYFGVLDRAHAGFLGALENIFPQTHLPIRRLSLDTLSSRNLTPYLYQEVIMTGQIQETISNGCQGFTAFCSSAAQWFGRMVTEAGVFISDTASKVAEAAKPYFEHVKTFAQKNGDSIIVGAIAFTLGSIITAAITNFFCSRSANTGSQAPV